MEHRVKEILQFTAQKLGVEYSPAIIIEPPKDERFGDITTNMAMVLAKELKKNPRAIAEEIIPFIESIPEIEEVSVAGAGFINMRFHISYWHTKFLEIEHKPLYTPQNKTEKVLIEFVSANPTGPLHVGHARGAVYGDALRRIYEYAGYTVHTEYYVNDAGNQMKTLGRSVYLRVLELHGATIQFPEDYYQGSYIIDIAKTLSASVPELHTMEETQACSLCQEYATKEILAGIQKDLEDFLVYHKEWFSESSLLDNNCLAILLDTLQTKGFIYEQEGALWFASTMFGDDKDRVVRKQDGSYTYFASDIAYHANKLARGYTKLINILGSDHHGYVERLCAAVQAVGGTKEALHVILIQLVSLVRNGKPISMSTRSGTFETLHDLLQEVGVDASRFMFLSRRNDSPLEFDLDIVTKKTMENPVYYVQYAHARIASLVRRYETECKDFPLATTGCITELTAPEEIALLKAILQFPECISSAVQHTAPHILTQYATELATLFHKYYARYPLCSAENYSCSAIRLRLALKVQETLAQTLYLLGVSAPKEM